jgi:endonuclease YncB( thermonuclease family)
MRQRKYQLGSERAFQAIWFGLLLLLLVTPLPALAEPDYPALPIEGLTEGEPATVIEVTDGDTLTLDDGRVVRLVGIQVPKLPLGRRGFRKWPLADESKQLLAALSLGQRVTPYIGGRGMDRWGRVLAHLQRDDGIWLQGALLQAGLARTYSFADNTALVAETLALEQAARNDHRQMWGRSYYTIRAASGVGPYEGSFQLVEGIVLDVARVRGRPFLNFGSDYRTDFTVLAPSKVRRAFEKAGQPLEALKGQVVRVRGWVKEWNGAMIELTHMEQLERLSSDEAAP